MSEKRRKMDRSVTLTSVYSCLCVLWVFFDRYRVIFAGQRRRHGRRATAAYENLRRGSPRNVGRAVGSLGSRLRQAASVMCAETNRSSMRLRVAVSLIPPCMESVEGKCGDVRWGSMTTLASMALTIAHAQSERLGDLPTLYARGSRERP
jgi:hypothetical protein